MCLIYNKILKVTGMICVFILCMLPLSGCQNTEKKDDNKLNIVTVDFVQYDFVRSICKDSADVKMIMKPGAEIHGYEPSLSDISLIRNADVFIYNGGESDVWVEKILDSFDSSSIATLKLMDYALLLEESHSSISHSHNNRHGVHDHSGEDECEDKHGYDEHIWTSPSNAVIMLDAICKALSEKNPPMSVEYQKNKADYAKEIIGIGDKFDELCKSSERRFAIVADRFPFLYLFHEYDIDYMALFPGCSHENDANPAVIIDIIKKIKSESIPCVFYTETSDQKAADTICKETGAKKMLLHSCQRISDEDFKKGISYADIMKENYQALKEVLK